MSLQSWLRHSVHIARVERTRSRRQPGRSSKLRVVLAVALVGISIGSGVGAYVFGRALSRGDVSMPLRLVQAAVVAGCAMLVWTSAQKTAKRVERIDTDYLLTTVRVREAVLGVVFVVYSQTVVPILLLGLGVAAGFGAGTRSPASAVAIAVAATGLVTLTNLLGIALSLAAKLATLRSPRLRRYRNYAYALAFLVGLFAWAILIQGPVSNERVVDWLRQVPFAWFVDLGLLPTAVRVEVARGVGALALTVAGVPTLTWLTIALARRAWTTDPVSATAIHHSQSLVGDGLAASAFAGWVPTPALTVARKRWLQERRLPRGLFYQGFVLVLAPVVYLPILATGNVPGISVVALASLCAVGTVLAFGLDFLGTEYSSLPMTLTSVSGRNFVQGTTLAGGAISTPITIIAVFAVGIWSSLTGIELLLVALSGAVLSVAGLLFAVVLGLRVSYYAFMPVSIPLTDMTVYTDRNGYLRLGLTLALLGLLVLPASVAYGSAFVGESAVSAFGASPALTRSGSLVSTIVLAVGVSLVAYRRAIRAYERYTFP